MHRLSARMRTIEPFHVMDILARARALEAQGRSIVHMEIGEPDFATPRAIVDAGIAALQQGRTHYTPTLGLPELRAAIAYSYAPSAVAPARVVVTPGSSGALQLVFGALLDAGDEVLMTDPGYPCNRHFVRLFDGVAKLIPVDRTSDYQLNADLVRSHLGARTKAVLLASPANPTGTHIPQTELREIIRICEARGVAVIVDEIYLGLTYDVDADSACAYSDNVFVVNSFSKYFGMTGWRLGWLVAPESLVPTLDKLAQNIFLAPSTPAQYAALAAFSGEVQRELQGRREEFKRRRDYLLPALRDLGFDIPYTPQGAFYIYANCSRLTDDSQQFAQALLEQCGVAITPGLDFGNHRAKEHVRFSYANDMEKLKSGVRALASFIADSNKGAE